MSRAVLLVLSAGVEPVAALAEARAIAQTLQARLKVVFVEDSALIHLPGQPIVARTGQTLALGADALRARMQTEAARVKRLVGELDIVRSSLTDVIEERASLADLVVLGRLPGRLGASPLPAAIRRCARPVVLPGAANGPVIVHIEGPRGAIALSFAHALGPTELWYHAEPDAPTPPAPARRLPPGLPPLQRGTLILPREGRTLASPHAIAQLEEARCRVVLI